MSLESSCQVRSEQSGFQVQVAVGFRDFQVEWVVAVDNRVFLLTEGFFKLFLRDSDCFSIYKVLRCIDIVILGWGLLKCVDIESHLLIRWNLPRPPLM